MTLEPIGLVLLTSNRREHASVGVLPLLDLVVVALDVRAEALPVCVQPFLHRREPCLPRVVVGIHTAQLEQVVLDLLEDQRVDVALGSFPVGSLPGLERNELDGVPALLGVSQQGDRAFREACLLPGEEVLQLVIR